nr:immunoglobulin heavy chain junction region [Mus musculus]
CARGGAIYDGYGVVWFAYW